MAIIYTIFFIGIVAAIIIKPKKLPEGVIALLGMFALILFGLINATDIPQSIFGNDIFNPFGIIIILITLAILSTTLDDFGFFKYVAYKAILWSKNNPTILFRNFFILTVILTAFTSNDVDVLTITPIILWFALITEINPFPYLFAVFVASNTSSMEFVFGNLTNIVVAEVFGLPFLEFFLIMIIPTILTLTLQYFLLKLIFRKQLKGTLIDSKRIEKISETIKKPLPNKSENYFVLTVLGFVILGAIITDFTSIDLWIITTLGALIVLFSGKFNIYKRLKKIPWNVVLFVLVFIVLTERLQAFGIIGKLTSFFTTSLDSTFSAVMTSGIVSGLLSGIINNIPASISLSSVFHTLTLYADPALQKAVAYGIVVGTNIGAIITPIGALATILWLTLIRQKKIEFPMKKFLIYGFTIGIISIIFSSLIIGIEIFLFY